MATQIQWRRGNTAQTASFTGAVAEITVDTDKKTIVVHDGTTAGGIPLARESYLTSNAAIAQGAYDKANSANVLAQLAFDKANTDVTSISTSAGTYGSVSIVPVIYLEANGRVSSVTNTTIAIGASAITSGTLNVARGGTGFSSYTANGVIIGGVTSTSALTSVASATEGHVLQISSSGVPTFAHLNGGSF